MEEIIRANLSSTVIFIIATLPHDDKVDLDP